MKTTLTRVGTILATMTLFVQCQKDLEGTEVLSQQPQESLQAVDSNTDYPRLENPYSVTNMKKALESLKSKTSKGPDNAYAAVNIKPTHLYVKFIPRNEAELSAVKRDTLIELYEHPLDVEDWVIQTYFTYDTASNRPPELWAAVKVGHRLPRGCPSQILERLYIPDEMKHNPRGKNTTVPHPFADELVEESFRLTGNPLNKTTVKAAKWTPAGTIKVHDDVLATYVGVEGVKVRARRWFTTHWGIANSIGDYVCNGQFKREANYSIDWEKYDFEIRDVFSNSTFYYAPDKIKGDWNLNISAGDQKFYATIFRAAFHYYHKNIQGLRRPPNNKFFTTQLKIMANNYYSASNGNHCPGCRFLGIGSAIKIYNPNRPSSAIYGTVIHEIAHASHWKMDGSGYRNSDLIVAESWARGVQWELTRMVYNNYPGGLVVRPNYTQVVVDMIDFPSDSNNGSENLLQDNVEGYSIRQIEDALINQTSWENWKNNIKSKFHNETKDNLDALFNHWN